MKGISILIDDHPWESASLGRGYFFTSVKEIQASPRSCEDSIEDGIEFDTAFRTLARKTFRSMMEASPNERFLRSDRLLASVIQKPSPPVYFQLSPDNWR